MRGVTRSVPLNVVFNGAGTNPLTQVQTLGFSATASIRRSEFGLGAWIPAVGNQVLLEIEAEFVCRDCD
jgi:polyisoprenoid-binding protein YceI